MNKTEALQVLRKAAAYQPSQRIDELTAEAWHEALAAQDCRDALEAVAKLCGTARPEGKPFLLTVGEIADECRWMRHKRYEARERLLPLPPSGLNARDYQRWRKAVQGPAYERDWTPPPAIEAAADPRMEAVLANILRPEDSTPTTRPAPKEKS